jgi:hypothetical protein
MCPRSRYISTGTPGKRSEMTHASVDADFKWSAVLQPETAVLFHKISVANTKFFLLTDFKVVDFTGKI